MNLGRRLFYFVFKSIFGIYAILFQHVRFKRNKIKLPKGPILFLSNHQTDWDAVYLNVFFFGHNIRFIAHDELYKNFPLRFIFGTCLGNVKRGSSHRDPSGVKEILRLKKEKANIGIYPEGDIHMFGETLPYSDSISKLAKKLKMPIALLNISGGHLRAPRWSKYPHRSRIVYSLNKVITQAELNELSIDELYKLIHQYIDGNEMEYQKMKMIPQFAFNRAESLEYGLFYCPKCHEYETIATKMNTIYCKNCDFIAKFNRYSFFEYPHTFYKFKTTNDWNNYQLQELEKKIENTNEDEVIIKVDNLQYSFATYGSYFNNKEIKNCNLSIYKNRIEIEFIDENNTITYLINEIIEATLQYKATLELQLEDYRIRFCTKVRKWSAYLYVCCINIIKQLTSRD